MTRGTKKAGFGGISPVSGSLWRGRMRFGLRGLRQMVLSTSRRPVSRKSKILPGYGGPFAGRDVACVSRFAIHHSSIHAHSYIPPSHALSQACMAGHLFRGARDASDATASMLPDCRAHLVLVHARCDTVIHLSFVGSVESRGLMVPPNMQIEGDGVRGVDCKGELNGARVR